MTALAVAHPRVDGTANDRIHLVRGPELLDHAGSGQPREQDSCRGGSAVQDVVEVLETGDQRCVVGDVIASDGPYRGLEEQLRQVSNPTQGVARPDVLRISSQRGRWFPTRPMIP